MNVSHSYKVIIIENMILNYIYLNLINICSRCKYEIIEQTEIYTLSRNTKCFENTIFDINYSLRITHTANINISTGDMHEDYN